MDPLSTPAPGVPAAYASVLESKGYRVNGANGTWCEVWFRKAVPTTGAKPSESNVALPIAQGTLLGVIRFPGAGSDRRGQTAKAGIYTMRYSLFPVDGAHQGVAPQRDFALLTPIANDADPNAMPGFDKLVEMSKTAGTSHALVLSLEAPAGGAMPVLVKEGENDWVLYAKAGDLGLGLIVVGKVEG